LILKSGQCLTPFLTLSQFIFSKIQTLVSFRFVDYAGNLRLRQRFKNQKPQREESGAKMKNRLPTSLSKPTDPIKSLKHNPEKI
jgi:hypothetical protein